MKKINITIRLFMLMLLASSCVNDLGNYNYISPEELLPISVSGLKDTTVIINTELNITPVIANMDNEGRYEYLWFVTPTTTAGSLPVRDTLAQTKNLSVKIQKAPTSYYLTFMVLDKKKDIYAHQRITLTVAGTTITSGYYVLKDSNDETDFDYITKTGEMTPNVLKEVVGGMQLKGKAVQVEYQSSYYCHENVLPDGTVQLLTGQRAMHILSDKDMKTFNAATMLLFKDYESEFYNFNEVVERTPQHFRVGSDANYLINGNKVHNCYTMASHTGRFGYAVGSISSRVHSQALMQSQNMIVFDKTTRSFGLAAGSGTTINPYNNNTVNPDMLSPSNMEYDIVQLIDKGVNGQGYALLRHITNGKHIIARIVSTSGAAYPFTVLYDVPAGCQMPTAPVVAAPRDVEGIYFATDNRLQSYKLGDVIPKEVVLRTFPAGETISFIKNIYVSGTTGFNRLFVLTNSTSGWKLYVFNMIGSTEEFSEEPVEVFSGTGTARYVMFRNS